jgi:hypothetical protein
MWATTKSMLVIRRVNLKKLSDELGKHGCTWASNLSIRAILRINAICSLSKNDASIRMDLKQSNAGSRNAYRQRSPTN